MSLLLNKIFFFIKNICYSLYSYLLNLIKKKMSNSTKSNDFKAFKIKNIYKKKKFFKVFFIKSTAAKLSILFNTLNLKIKTKFFKNIFNFFFFIKKNFFFYKNIKLIDGASLNNVLVLITYFVKFFNEKQVKNLFFFYKKKISFFFYKYIFNFFLLKSLNKKKLFQTFFNSLMLKKKMLKTKLKLLYLVDTTSLNPVQSLKKKKNWSPLVTSGNIVFHFLRKNMLYNKGRYSRNKQNYRTGVFLCIWLTVLTVIGLYFYFYYFLIKFTYFYFLFFIFIFSFCYKFFFKFDEKHWKWFF